MAVAIRQCSRSLLLLFLFLDDFMDSLGESAGQQWEKDEKRGTESGRYVDDTYFSFSHPHQKGKAFDIVIC